MLSDAEIYEIGRAVCKEVKSKKDALFNLCAYGCGFEDGSVYDPEYYSCHLWFRNMTPVTDYTVRPFTTRTIPKSKPIVMVNTVQTERRGCLPKPERDKFFDYLLNRSPFKSAFLSKDTSKLEDDGIMVRLDVPYNLAIAAGILTRAPWEWPGVVTTFINLVAAGLHEDRAFLVAHLVRWVNAGGLVRQITVGHTGININSMTADGVKNFLDHELPKRSRGPTYQEHRTYGGIDAMWNNKDVRDFPLKSVQQVCSTQTTQREDPFGTITKAVRKEDNLIDRINTIIDGVIT